VVGLLIGGIANPLYSLLLAHTNDYLEREDMAAASGGLLFINGLGAIAGPLLTGWIMGVVGPNGFFLYIGVLSALVSAYAMYRMTRRVAPNASETGAHAIVMPESSAVTMGAVYEAAQDGQEPAGSAP
jgi:MFS family permease